MNRPLDLFRALRPKQWTKNLIVLAPLIFALGDKHVTLPGDAVLRILLAMGLFCLASSGVYLINDLKDINRDQFHPQKRFRPIAAGRVSPRVAGIMAALLIAAALMGGMRLAQSYGVLLAVYFAMQLAYSFGLKRVALLDVFIIAAGFVFRAIGGGLAIDVVVSPWLLVCTFLLALFLALCKRRHELRILEGGRDNHRPSLGDYHPALVDQLISIVCAATIVSYSVYTLSPETVAKFGTTWLSATIPFVIFGIFRYLDLVYRKEAGGRPEHIFLTDKVLLADIALYGIVVGGIFLRFR